MAIPHHKGRIRKFKVKLRQVAPEAGWFPVRLPVEYLAQPAECLARYACIADSPHFARLREN
jgi:hypothetical protein